MSAPITEGIPPEGQVTDPTPPAPRSLEDLLAGLDDDARTAVLGEVSKARNEAKGLRGRLKDAEPKVAEYDRLAEASKTELDKAQESATASAARIAQLLGRAVKAEVKALAAGTFADPEDAAAFLDLSKYAGDDGEVDTGAITADLSDLIGRKPHLGRTETSRIPKPNAAQGSSGSGGGAKSQLSAADVKRMYDTKQYEQIEQARAEGRLNGLLGVTT